MRRLLVVPIAILITGCPAAAAAAPDPPAASAAQAAAQAGPAPTSPAPVTIVIPKGPRTTLTSRMVMVGRADGESERITMRLTFAGGSAELVERTETGPTMFIGGGDRNPKRWKQRSVRRFTGTTAFEDGWRRFHLVEPDGRKLELTCMKDAVDAMARNVVATRTTCAAGCDCQTVWDPPETTPVSGVYCFDPGGVTFQQFFSSTEVDYVYENDACTRGDGYRMR